MSGISGSTMLLRVEDPDAADALKTLACELSSELSTSADMIETTCKGSVDLNGRPTKTYIAGEYGFTFSVEGIYDPAGDWNFSEILAKLKAGTQLTFQFGGSGVGDTFFTGAGIINEATLSAPKNDVVSVSASIQGVGELAEATVQA